MTSVINKSFFNDFISLCAQSQVSISLCAPFVKSEIVDKILSVKQSSAEIKLITNVNLKSFRSGASDIDALNQLISFDASVRTFSRLHAKVYIFDSKTCVITSSNLTPSGLIKNYEYGVISDEHRLVDNAVNDFTNLYESELTGIINNSHIAKISKIISELPLVPVYNLPKLDFIEAEDVFSDDIKVVINNLNGWDKSLFIVLSEFPDTCFSTATFPIFIEKLKPLYPNNHTIEAKIRQVLQHLRDFGLIQFISPGKYRKLWI